MALDHHLLESGSATTAENRVEPSFRAWARRLSRELAMQDWLVLGYLMTLALAVATAEPAPNRAECLKQSFGLLGFCTAVLVVVRGGLARDRFFAPLGYRFAVYGTVQLSYFMLRDLLPVVNPGSLDQELFKLDLKWFGFEPTLFMDRFVTPATTEWFAFFYYSYFFLLAVHVIPFIFASRRLRLLSEFSFGMIFVYAIAHIGYMLVPGYGPYKHLADYFQNELPSGMWMNAVWAAVESGGAQKDIFPSLHTGGPVFITLFSFRHRDKLPFKYTWPITAFFTVNIVIATMFLRWHYLIDVVVGAALAAFGFWLTGRIAGPEHDRREAEGLQPVWSLFFDRTPLPEAPKRAH